MSSTVSFRWYPTDRLRTPHVLIAAAGPLWSALSGNPVRPGERHLCHCGSLHGQGDQIFWLEVVYVALAVCPSNGLTLQRQDAEVVGEAPAGLDGIDPLRKCGILRCDAGRILTFVPIVVATSSRSKLLVFSFPTRMVVTKGNESGRTNRDGICAQG